MLEDSVQPAFWSLALAINQRIGLGRLSTNVRREAVFRSRSTATLLYDSVLDRTEKLDGSFSVLVGCSDFVAIRIPNVQFVAYEIGH